MSAKDKILTAFEDILIGQGEKAATMDAVAKAAGVSKGGLLYHFPSKEALATALVQRFNRLVEADMQTMSQAPEGASTYYINSSVYADTEFDRALVAISRLAQESNLVASQALRESQQRATELILAEVGHQDAARAIVLLSDGMYFNAAFMHSIDRTESELTEQNDRRILLETVEKLKKMG